MSSEESKPIKKVMHKGRLPHQSDIGTIASAVAAVSAAVAADPPSTVDPKEEVAVLATALATAPATALATAPASPVLLVPAVSKPKKGIKGKSAGKSKLVGDRPLFAGAIEAFLRANTEFESSIPIKDAMADIIKSTKLDEVFVIPMRHKVLSMSGCLRFALFLHVAGAEPLEEGEAAFTGSSKFSAGAALEAISKCFDEGTNEVVWECIHEAEDAIDEAASDSESG